MRTRSSFNPLPTVRKVKNRVRGFQASLPEQLRRAGRLVAVSLATSAVPYGTSGNARTAGEQATKSDIRRCYATLGDVYKDFGDKEWADQFWAAVKQGHFAKAERLMRTHCPKFHNKEIKPFDGGSAHRANRNRRGRISKRQEPVFVLRSLSRFHAYVKKEVRQVGFGKAGWAVCAKILGGARGLPQWVTRHKAPGVVIEDQNTHAPSITLVNQVDYADQILEETDKRQAVRIGLERLSEALIREERQLARANQV